MPYLAHPYYKELLHDLVPNPEWLTSGRGHGDCGLML